MNYSQEELYSKISEPMLDSFLEGYNCTVIAYGQTGSGKTYTMGTSNLYNQNNETQGLIPRFVNGFFDKLNHLIELNKETTTYKARVSFVEIYGEDVYDLLASNRASRVGRPSLVIREDEYGKVFVLGQTEIEVTTPMAALKVLNNAASYRTTASTAMNFDSSRSHAVFAISLEQITPGHGETNAANELDDITLGTNPVIVSRLTFVDLAGSERIKSTNAKGNRMKEGIQINADLFNLGQVINQLTDDSKPAGKNGPYIPYRNSKLTFLLKNSLSGNSQTFFLACVSPAQCNANETSSTLNVSRL
jgi:hypothetical protein